MSSLLLRGHFFAFDEVDECIGDLGIELGAGVAFELFEDLGRGEGGPVRPVAGHGVVCIGDDDHAGDG